MERGQGSQRGGQLVPGAEGRGGRGEGGEAQVGEVLEHQRGLEPGHVSAHWSCYPALPTPGPLTSTWRADTAGRCEAGRGCSARS